MQDIEHLVDTLHFEDLQNREHPAVFDKNDAYTMLIIRIPAIHEHFTVLSMGFILTAEESYLYDRSYKQLKKLESRFNSPHQKIDSALDLLLHAFTAYQDRISNMEESLYEEHPKLNFMAQWLTFKKDILRIERVMLHTTTIMKEMVDAYKEEEDFPLNHYLDIHEHCGRILRAATLQLSKLDYLYTFYNTRTNEKMNRLIFILTIISAIFLPLNLIVGFFGMNTSSLPFTIGTGGTLKVVMMMAALVLLTSAVVLLWRYMNARSE